MSVGAIHIWLTILPDSAFEQRARANFVQFRILDRRRDNPLLAAHLGVDPGGEEDMAKPAATQSTHSFEQARILHRDGGSRRRIKYTAPFLLLIRNTPTPCIVPACSNISWAGRLMPCACRGGAEGKAWIGRCAPGLRDDPRRGRSPRGGAGKLRSALALRDNASCISIAATHSSISSVTRKHWRATIVLLRLHRPWPSHTTIAAILR